MESRFALVGRASVRIWHPAPPPRRGPDAFPATKAAADASFVEGRRHLRPLLCLAAFALALWPHWRWAAARLGDGSDAEDVHGVMVRLTERGERPCHLGLNVVDADKRTPGARRNRRAARDPRHHRDRDLDVRHVAQVEQLGEGRAVCRIRLDLFARSTQIFLRQHAARASDNDF